MFERNEEKGQLKIQAKKKLKMAKLKIFWICESFYEKCEEFLLSSAN